MWNLKGTLKITRLPKDMSSQLFLYADFVVHHLHDVLEGVAV